MIIHPYRRGSQSAKALRDALEKRGEHTVILHRRPKRAGARIISWGAKGIDYDLKGLGGVLNPPEITSVLSDKLRFFRHIGHGTGFVPNWCDTPAGTKDFETTVIRHTTGGKGGDGIEIVEGSTDIKAPLYTEYQKKTDEYRLHVFRKNRAFYVAHSQKKVAAPDQKDNIKDWKVRNAENGFIFQIHGFQVPEAVDEAAIGLVAEFFPRIDFVALDVIYHRPTDKAYVLEGNTAPGMEGTTVQVYADYFMARKQEGWV